MVELATPSPEFPRAPVWTPPIQRTVSTEGAGIPELANLIAQHRHYLHSAGGWQRRERVRLQAGVQKIIQETLLTRWRAGLQDGDYEKMLEAVFERKISPYEAAERLTNGMRE
jgi:LAO/AO transport system kinase